MWAPRDVVKWKRESACGEGAGRQSGLERAVEKWANLPRPRLPVLQPCWFP